MKDLSVPQLNLFSNSPTRHDEYRHKMSMRGGLESAGDIQMTTHSNRYKYSYHIRESSRSSSNERRLSAEADRRKYDMIERKLYDAPRRALAAPVPISVPVPLPLIEVLPPPPPPVLSPPLILRPDPICRGSRIYSVNATPATQNKYYEMSKIVLQEAGRYSPRSSRKIQIPKGNVNRSYEATKHANYQPFSISKNPYLTEPTTIKNVAWPKYPQKPAQLQSKKPKSEPPNKETQAPELKNQIQIPVENPKPLPPVPAPQIVVTLDSFHGQLFDLFKDLLERQHINFRQYRNTHQKQWIAILKEINKLRRQDQLRQMRMRIRQWRKKALPALDQITQNVSIYTEVAQNDSFIRRDLREVEETRQKFDRKLEERYQQIEEYDFELDRSARRMRDVDISEIIRLKNEDLQLYRDLTGKIGKLIQRYEEGEAREQKKIFSFFD